MKRPALTALLCLLATAAAAEAPPDPGGGDLWSRTREEAGAWWERSRASADEWWQRGQEAASGTWESTRGLFDPGEQDHFGTVWKEVLPTLEETLALTERHETLPEDRWFGADRESNRGAIDALLDEAVAILSNSGVSHHRDRIRFLEGEIDRARRDIAEYRQRRVTAPAESLVHTTAEGYAQAIAAREADIARYEADLASVKREFAAELKAMGIILEEDQVDLLLSTVVGDNLVDLGVVFDNVKAVTAQLEHLVAESGEDLEAARRYYGMYVVLLRSLEEMHRDVEQAIAGQYVPRIDAITERARRLTSETRALQERSPDKAALLAANLDAQRLTLEAAAVYRRYLTEQADEVARARQQLAADIAAAWNTYETVRVSGELVALVRSSRELIQGLLDRQVPPLRPFENREMQRELERLTSELRAGGRG